MAYSPKRTKRRYVRRKKSMKRTTVLNVIKFNKKEVAAFKLGMQVGKTL